MHVIILVIILTLHQLNQSVTPPLPPPSAGEYMHSLLLVSTFIYMFVCIYIYMCIYIYIYIDRYILIDIY